MHSFVEKNTEIYINLILSEKLCEKDIFYTLKCLSLSFKVLSSSPHHLASPDVIWGKLRDKVSQEEERQPSN